MSIYSATVSNTSISSTANDILTIVPAANTTVQIVEFSVAGCGTASSAAQVNIYNITTAGATGGGAITPAKFQPFAPASSSTVNTTWTTQPTVGSIIVPLAVNGNGGIYRWVARPGEEIYAFGNAAVGVTNFLGFSIRASLAPSTNFTVSVVWTESPF